MKVQILVRLKPSVLDVQGKAVEHSLIGLGYVNLENVRIGKLIEFNLEAEDETDAKSKVAEMCTKLLTNPIIENYEVKFI